MATGFIERHSMAILLASFAGLAAAADVALVGVIGDKAAVISIDGGGPKTVRVGQQFSGITVISVDGDRAVLLIDGKRRTLSRGQHAASIGSSGGEKSGRQRVVLAADPRGHFIAEGAINGGPIRFMVDTGATAIAIPAADAQRLGIDYRKGRRIIISTANGNAPAFLVKFDTVRIGDIELTNVDGMVSEQGLSLALLGMTFLNRVEMQREGQAMTLTRRF